MSNNSNILTIQIILILKQGFWGFWGFVVLGFRILQLILTK
jgi:hypothetical protein